MTILTKRESEVRFRISDKTQIKNCDVSTAEKTQRRGITFLPQSKKGNSVELVIAWGIYYLAANNVIQKREIKTGKSI